MAVVLIEGWDHMTAAEVPSKGWTNGPASFQPGRFDGQSFRTTSASVTQKTLPSTYTTLFVGIAVRFTTAATTTNNWLTLFTAAAGVVMTLSMDGSGHILVKNSGGTTIATSATALISNTWYYVEFKIVVNGASGSIELHINGVTDIGTTTGNFGSTAISIFRVGANGANTDNDDIYVLDSTGSAPRNTFLGDVRVETIYPTSDGAHSQWTPNSGSTHYTQVNETLADGDTTYVSDLTPNDLDTYGFADIDTGATVYGVQVNMYARKDDANTRQIAPVIRQSGSDNVGTTVTLASTYLFYSQLYNQDPTSADWTPTTLNADEIGVKEIA